MENLNPSEWIDLYLRRDTRERRVGVYHPSELPWCMRQLYYRYTLPKPWPREKLRVFKSSDLAHHFIREVLASAPGVRLLGWEREFSLVYPGFEIRGRMDDLISVQVEGRELPMLVEVKSVGAPHSFEKLDRPKHEHVCQIMPYLRVARALGMVWYLQRSTYEDKHFAVSYDPKVMLEVESRASRLHQALVGRRLPPPESRKERAWECGYCLYAPECEVDLEAGG